MRGAFKQEEIECRLWYKEATENKRAEKDMWRGKDTEDEGVC